MFNLEKEFKILVKNGWLTDEEADKFVADENIKKCIKSFFWNFIDVLIELMKGSEF